MKCKWCGSMTTVLDGKNPSGSQRCLCKACQRYFTPIAIRIDYEDDLKVVALRHYVDGNNYRRTGRQLGINHQTIVNWVKAAADKAAAQPVPKPQVDDSTIVENKLTMDGVENYAYHGDGAFGGGGETNVDKEKNKNKRKPTFIYWSPDSKHFSMVKSDVRKVKDLLSLSERYRGDRITICKRETGSEK